jgi:hypothetical protein
VHISKSPVARLIEKDFKENHRKILTPAIENAGKLEVYKLENKYAITI